MISLYMNMMKEMSHIQCSVSLSNSKKVKSASLFKYNEKEVDAVMKTQKKICMQKNMIFRSIFYILVEKVSFLVLFIVQCIFSAKKSSYNVNIGNKKHQSWFINDKIIPKENPAKKFAVQKISLMHAMLIQFNFVGRRDF